MSCRPSAPCRTAGFTLIEMLIVLVVIGVLAALAWPSLQEAVHRSRRADAIAALSKIQQAQERWRANHPAYQDTLTGLSGAATTASPDQHYDLSLVTEGLDLKVAYAARATARSSSPQNKDTRCHWLQVSVNGGNITYTSGAGDSANAAPDPCWVR